MEEMQSLNNQTYTTYNNYAWFWNKYWGRTSAKKAFPVLSQLLLNDLPPGASIVDVCCGTGQLAQLIARKGYDCAGIDGSEEMIRYARENYPHGIFVVGDIRTPFPFQERFHAACSLFDSLNHILHLEQLVQVFRNVHDRLLAGGKFMFDLNMEEGYKQRWDGKSFHIVQSNHVCIDQMFYDPDSRMGRNNVTIFLQEAGWQRLDVKIEERCYTQQEIRDALTTAGFKDIAMYEANAQFGFKDEIGRYYIICGK